MLLYVCVTNPSSSWTFPSKYDAQASWPSSIPCSVSSLTITATFNEPSMMLMMVDSSRFRFLKFFFPGLFKLYKVRSLPSSGQTLALDEPEARLYNHQPTRPTRPTRPSQEQMFVSTISQPFLNGMSWNFAWLLFRWKGWSLQTKPQHCSIPCSAAKSLFGQ